MENEVVDSLVRLVEQIAAEDLFDEQKYFRFNELLGSLPKQLPALGEAANELDEFYATWAHMKKHFMADPAAREEVLGDDRETLRRLAADIRSQASALRSEG